MPNEGSTHGEELKAKAYQPMECYHRIPLQGQIEPTLKCCVRDFQHFDTPGVNRPCLEIQAGPQKAANTGGRHHDGTRVGDGRQQAPRPACR